MNAELKKKLIAGAELAQKSVLTDLESTREMVIKASVDSRTFCNSYFNKLFVELGRSKERLRHRRFKG
jgi:hypothetical protein